MIDVKPYIDKLDMLMVYIRLRIEEQPFEIWMDLQVCPTEYYIKNNLPIPRPYKEIIRFAPNNFNEWLKTQPQQGL